jgi:hypothetical protein
MCSINHQKKAIFIHIPKTGGTYIAEILSKHYGFQNYYLQRPDHDLFCLGKDDSVKFHENKIHGTLMYYKTSSYINERMNMNEQKWNEYFIFAFIRNPYDKIISGWNYCNKYNQSFHKYIENVKKMNSFDYWHIFMPQSRHIINQKGKINIHHIGHFEELEKELRIVLQKIGFQEREMKHIPYKKNSKEHLHYSLYYTQDILDQVNILLQEDFKNLDYKKYEKVENLKIL